MKKLLLSLLICFTSLVSLFAKNDIDRLNTDEEVMAFVNKVYNIEGDDSCFRFLYRWREIGDTLLMDSLGIKKYYIADFDGNGFSDLFVTEFDNCFGGFIRTIIILGYENNKFMIYDLDIESEIGLNNFGGFQQATFYKPYKYIKKRMLLIRYKYGSESFGLDNMEIMKVYKPYLPSSKYPLIHNEYYKIDTVVYAMGDFINYSPVPDKHTPSKLNYRCGYPYLSVDVDSSGKIMVKHQGGSYALVEGYSLCVEGYVKKETIALIFDLARYMNLYSYKVPKLLYENRTDPAIYTQVFYSNGEVRKFWRNEVGIGYHSLQYLNKLLYGLLDYSKWASVEKISTIKDEEMTKPDFIPMGQ